MKAFSAVGKKFEKTRKRDAFVVALDRSTRKVKAFEYQVSATEVWQAREKDDGLLAGERLDLHVEKKRVAAACRPANVSSGIPWPRA